jgi:5-methylcytosine-specific restriction endonuclease McrA
VKFPKSVSVKLEGKDYLELKRRVWERDERSCVWCGVQLAMGEAHLDHIQLRSHGRLDTEENTRTLCPMCHHKRHNE